MARKFSPEQTLQLVRLYRDHECLWNIYSDLYRSSHLKKKALSEMCNDLNIPDFTVNDLKIKIKVIRSTYCIELDKIQKRKTTGYVYKPRVIWFDELNSYLKDVTLKKKRMREDSEPSASASHGSDNELQIEYYSDSETDEFDSKSTLYIVKPEREDPLCQGHLQGLSSEPEEGMQLDIVANNSNSRFKKGSRQRLATPIEKCNARARQLVDGDIKDREDEFDIFGKHVAHQLRKLSTMKYILAQKEIQGTITKFRMDDING